MVEMSYFWRLLYVGSEGQYEHLLTKLPLQVCQWTLISTCFMMAKKSPHLFSMTFFLTMSTGLIPLFVPAVISKTGPAYYRYYQFWGEHLLPIIGMYYMMFVHGFKPKPIGAGYALGMLGLLSIPAAIANANIEEASFLYLKNTDSFAMLTFLPKSLAGKLALYAVVILALFAAVYGIYLLVIKFASKNKQLNKNNHA